MRLETIEERKSTGNLYNDIYRMRVAIGSGTEAEPAYVISAALHL